MMFKKYEADKGKTITEQDNHICMFLPDESKNFYEKVINKIILNAELTCNSYLAFLPGNGLEHIWENLLKSQAVIADVTGFKPSVMFELGTALAHKDEIDIIIICNVLEQNKTIPFNINQLNIIYYNPENPVTFEKKLKFELDKIISKKIVKPIYISSEAKKNMVRAKKMMANREWEIAEVLIEKAFDIEPKNWYILKEWAKLYRLMGGKTTRALEKLDLALEYTGSLKYKAKVYIEYGLLHSSHGEYDKAEEAFNKAEDSNPKDKELYVAWAKLFCHRNELNKAISKIAHIKDVLDGEDKEVNAWFDYLARRIRDSSFKLTFEEFHKKMGSDSENIKRVPYQIEWETLTNKYINTQIFGEVTGFSPVYVFVRLSRDFTGVILKEKMSTVILQKMSKNQKIKVKITNAFIDKKDNKPRIWLKYIYR